MNPTARPSWQTDTCPEWCVSEHREDDLPADRFHDSVGTYLTAMTEDPEVAQGARAVELSLALFRRCGTQEDWLHLSTPDEAAVRITLTPESARRLGHALLERATPDVAT